MKILLLSLLLIATSGSLSAAAEGFDHSAYRDSSMVAAGSNLGIDPRVTWWLDAAHQKFHTVATFTGNIRPVRPEAKSLIERWAKAMGHGPAVAELYASEIEVSQDGTFYWLPIQEVLVKPLQQEVPPGKAAHLYILLMGAYKLVPVFGVGEFNAVEG